MTTLDAGVTDATGFRDLMSRFPSGVAVITTVDERGLPRGMTCSSLASVCLEPPTLLVCLRTGSPTTQAVIARGAFAVNVLGSGARTVAETFSAPRADRFTGMHWTTSPDGLPWLPDDTAGAPTASWCRRCRSAITPWSWVRCAGSRSRGSRRCCTACAATRPGRSDAVCHHATTSVARTLPLHRAARDLHACGRSHSAATPHGATVHA